MVNIEAEPAKLAEPAPAEKSAAKAVEKTEPAAATPPAEAPQTAEITNATKAKLLEAKGKLAHEATDGFGPDAARRLGDAIISNDPKTVIQVLGDIRNAHEAAKLSHELHAELDQLQGELEGPYSGKPIRKVEEGASWIWNQAPRWLRNSLVTAGTGLAGWKAVQLTWKILKGLGNGTLEVLKWLKNLPVTIFKSIWKPVAALGIGAGGMYWWAKSKEDKEKTNA
jgi:hypothetical protein